MSARIAVAPHQHLTALHDGIQEAFGWLDDHLYSFWLDGRFWGDQDHELTSPLTPDEAPRTADVPLAELDLVTGRRIAYVFDFGDEWRVMLTLNGSEPNDGGAYPRVVSRRGVARLGVDLAALDEDLTEPGNDAGVLGAGLAEACQGSLSRVERGA